MPRKDIDYSRCIIYKIVCNDFNVKDLYVGHTTDLVKRRSRHKSTCNNPNDPMHSVKIYTIIRENGGWDNWSVIVVDNFIGCKNAEDARTRERYWFEQLNASLNSIRPLITEDESKEYDKQYREDNKEKLCNINKEWRELNKEKIIQKNKLYYECNKEQILEKDKIYKIKTRDRVKEWERQQYECQCGSSFRLYEKSRHNQSKKHQSYLNSLDNNETIKI